MACEICKVDIIEKNRIVVNKWSTEKQLLHFWYWNGVTNFGEEKISPYATEIIDSFNKRCGLE